ncbi:MAG: DUF6273 domain-containing protein [Clostridiales bacterium]|nr:DUF6273 domain-containing protein [Clostridiales bacterium]
MRKYLKRILPVLLTLLLLIPSGVALVSADGGYRVGDVIEYGTYPQTDVTETLGGILDSQSGTWRSYGYYSGTGMEWDGQMKPSDFMRYKDVVYNGEKYRGVTFDSYRPRGTGYESLPQGITCQHSKGYDLGKTYWFRFEPIKWRILDPASGFIMCDLIIDSQAYNNYGLESKTEKDGHNKFFIVWGDPDETFYANNYADSSIRQWLNSDFYNTAFSEEQKSNIKTTTLSNNCWQTINGDTSYGDYDAPSTADKVFLLSYDEAENKNYGFNAAEQFYDPARRLSGSDYAKCQGLGGNEYGYWWLRTPYYYPCHSSIVGADGGDKAGGIATDTDGGIVPALRLLELKTDPSGSDITYEPTITINGYTPKKTVGYKSSVTFTAKVSDPLPGAEIRWFIDGKDSGTGDTYTVTKAKKSYSVQVKYIKDSKTIAESGVETVNVKTGFFAKLTAFFLGVFGRLPKIVQAFPGVDIDKAVK